MKTMEIREVCGEYAIDLLLDHGSTFTIYFKSQQNALNVKQIIDADNGALNAAEYTRVVHGKIKWVNRPIHAQYAAVKDEHGETKCVKLHDTIEYNPVGYCSECRKRLDDTFMHYCPNCGAKMDGGSKNEIK